MKEKFKEEIRKEFKEGDYHKKRILFVDDMDESYKRISSLSKEGYEIDYVKTEKEALGRINTSSYNSVISDYYLGPDSPQGGLNVVRAAKQASKGLVVILTSIENHEKEAKKAGADKFVFKKDLFNYILSDIKKSLCATTS